MLSPLVREPLCSHMPPQTTSFHFIQLALKLAF